MSGRISQDKLNHYYSRILQEMALRTKGSFGRPTSVIVLLTNRCIARCIHCHSWKLPVDSPEMTTREWERVFDELRKWLGPVFVAITGGETLLRKDSIHLANYASKLGFWVKFLTNGYLMNPEVAEQLIRSGVKRIEISLDGSRAEIHDKVRGRDDFFSRVTEGLKALVEEKNRQKRDIKIWAKTTVMSLNLEDLPAIAKLAGTLELDGVEYQAVEPIYYSEQLNDPGWFENNPLWVTDLEKLSEMVQQLRRLKNQGYPIVNTDENLSLIEEYFYAPRRLTHKIQSHDYQKKYGQCRSWIGGLQIRPDGGLKMCHWMTPFANAKDGNLKQAWKNRDPCWKKPCHYISPG